jgi:hypothetical protein
MMEEGEDLGGEQVTQVMGTAEADDDNDIFVPPSQGSDILHSVARKNPQIAGLQLAIGDFQKALELMKKQLSVSNFKPLKQLFVDSFTLSKM